MYHLYIENELIIHSKKSVGKTMKTNIRVIDCFTLIWSLCMVAMDNQPPFLRWIHCPSKRTRSDQCRYYSSPHGYKLTCVISFPVHRIFKVLIKTVFSDKNHN